MLARYIVCRSHKLATIVIFPENPIQCNLQILMRAMPRLKKPFHANILHPSRKEHYYLLPLAELTHLTSSFICTTYTYANMS